MQSQILAGFLLLSNLREASRTRMDCRTVATSSMSSLQKKISICILPPDSTFAAVRMRTKRSPSFGRALLYSMSIVKVLLKMTDLTAYIIPVVSTALAALGSARSIPRQECLWFGRSHQGVLGPTAQPFVGTRVRRKAHRSAAGYRTSRG